MIIKKKFFTHQSILYVSDNYDIYTETDDTNYFLQIKKISNSKENIYMYSKNSKDKQIFEDTPIIFFHEIKKLPYIYKEIYIRGYGL
jgi:hypothetical protein